MADGELEPVVTDAWRDVASNADGELRVDLDGYTVRTDANRLQQLFENLFQNALKHAGTDVTVTVGSLDDRRGFFVAYDGPGIPEEVRDRVIGGIPRATRVPGSAWRS